MSAVRIGFIGQGWIGKHYADDFEHRGYTTVRYSLDPEYVGNKKEIGQCDLVFIAVPTPTRNGVFDSSIVESVLGLVGVGKIAVIKSTVLPGTTAALQKKFPDRIVLTSPEFLRESQAAYDAAHPDRNIIGIPEDTELYRTAAEQVLSVLAPAPFARIMQAEHAELVKYAGNVFLALKVVYANVLYDLTETLGGGYEQVAEALGADPRIGPSHLAVHAASGHATQVGRGAGGHCFIKDLEAFRGFHEQRTDDDEGIAFLAATIRKNNALLTESGKDLDLLSEVYPHGHPLRH